MDVGKYSGNNAFDLLELTWKLDKGLQDLKGCRLHRGFRTQCCGHFGIVFWTVTPWISIVIIIIDISLCIYIRDFYIYIHIFVIYIYLYIEIPIVYWLDHMFLWIKSPSRWDSAVCPWHREVQNARAQLQEVRISAGHWIFGCFKPHEMPRFLWFIN